MSENQKNGLNFLRNLFTADKVIAALVLLMGGGNLFVTKETDQHREAELNRAIVEVHQLYDQLNSAIDRQKEIRDLLLQLTKKQP